MIAFFFLVVDVAQGRPFWTPTSLGSQLLLGETPDRVAPQPVLIVAYTAFHGAVFVGLGLMAAFFLVGNRWRRESWAPYALMGCLFAGTQALFLTFAGVVAPSLVGDFGLLHVVAANLLASVVMTAALWRRSPSPSVWKRPPQRAVTRSSQPPRRRSDGCRASSG